MKSVLKLTSLCVFALTLSGCAFTQGVAQGLYDEKAQKECRPTSAASDSIHTAAKSNCVGGYYEPRPKKKSDWKKGE